MVISMGTDVQKDEIINYLEQAEQLEELAKKLLTAAKELRKKHSKTN